MNPLDESCYDLEAERKAMSATPRAERITDDAADEIKAMVNLHHVLFPDWHKVSDCIGALQFDRMDLRRELAEAKEALDAVNSLEHVKLYIAQGKELATTEALWRQEAKALEQATLLLSNAVRERDLMETQLLRARDQALADRGFQNENRQANRDAEELANALRDVLAGHPVLNADELIARYSPLRKEPK